MTTPSLLLGLVISLLYGSIFHLWRGGGFGRLLLYLFLGFSGFWIGQLIAETTRWTVFSIGSLHIGMATILSWTFLLVGYWLSLLPDKTKPTRKKDR